MKRFGGSIRGRLAKKAKTMATSAIKSLVKKGVSRIKKTKIYKGGLNKAQRAFHMLTNKTTMFQYSRQVTGMTNYGSATGATPVITGLELTAAANSEGTNPIQREGNRIFYKGFKLNALFVNPFTRTMQVNLACISPKGIRNLGGENFFRTNSLETNTNFNNVALTGFLRHTRAINADRYIIWWHKRFELGPIGSMGGLSSEVRKNTKKLRFYTKVNQPISFSTYAAPEPNPGEKADQQIFLCWWWSYIGDESFYAAAPANTLGMEYDIKHIWHDN
jgi:hypothetical protein